MTMEEYCKKPKISASSRAAASENMDLDDFYDCYDMDDEDASDEDYEEDDDDSGNGES